MLFRENTIWIEKKFLNKAPDVITYIHNCPLQPISQDYGLAFHATNVVCVLIFYMSGGTYSF